MVACLSILSEKVNSCCPVIKANHIFTIFAYLGDKDLPDLQSFALFIHKYLYFSSCQSLIDSLINPKYLNEQKFLLTFYTAAVLCSVKLMQIHLFVYAKYCTAMGLAEMPHKTL